MVLDRIEFYYICEQIPDNICFNELEYCHCKYDWLCTTRLVDEWTTMFYSEGE